MPKTVLSLLKHPWPLLQSAQLEKEYFPQLCFQQTDVKSLGPCDWQPLSGPSNPPPAASAVSAVV